MSEEQAHPKPNNLLPVLATAINGNELAHGRFDDCKVAIWDYANPEHFNSLWKSLEDGSVKDTSRVLIVWTKTLTDESLVPVNTVDHVSPVHWAACAAKKAAEVKARRMAEEKAKVAANTSEETHIQVEAEAKTPQLQVCVLDLNPTAHRSQYLYQHYLRCDKQRLPWLRVFQAAHFFGEQISSGEFQPDTNPLDLETIEGRFFPVLHFSAEKLVIEPASFCDHIREKLTSPSSPDNRHVIANIVGPIVLLNGAKILNSFKGESCYVKAGEKEQHSPKSGVAVDGKGAPPANHRSAIYGVFRATELLPPLSAKDANGGRGEGNQGDAKNQIKQMLASLPQHVKLRVTLVDDQWHHGWFEWLKSIFPPETAFTVCPDPQFLLNKLDAANEIEADLRFNFDLTPPRATANGNYADVLLLDLRLFSGNSIAEADFNKKLLSLCRKFEVSEAGSLVPLESPLTDGALCRVKNLAWAGFSTEALKSVAAWIDGGDGRNEANHRICLTLLPRLFALVDMPLPVVIFSSTGQRTIIHLLKDYKNVFTNFQKPTFFGTQKEPSDTSEQMVLAHRRTNEVHKARRICERIYNSPPYGASIPKAYRHFEIYIDESGSVEEQHFCVGGVMVGYADQQDALELHRAMEKEGLIWRGPNRIRKRGRFTPGRDVDSSRTTEEIWDDVDHRIVPILGKRPTIPVLMFRHPPPETISDTSDLAHPDALDNMYRALTSYLVEGLVFESLSAISEAYPEISLSIFLGTRTRHINCDSRANANALKKKLKNRWGITEVEIRERQTDNGGMIYECIYESIRDDSAYQVIEPTFTLRLNCRESLLDDTQAPQVKLIGAKGIRLSETDLPSEPSFRHIHYLADYLTHFANAKNTSFGYTTAGQLIQRSICATVERSNEDFLWLLDAGRRLAVGDTVSGLLKISLLGETENASPLK